MTTRTSIAIFGSRDVDRDTARALFEQHLASFVDQGRTWVLAGTRGIDEWAMEWLLERNELCWAVVPRTRFDQPKSIQARLEQAVAAHPFQSVIAQHRPALGAMTRFVHQAFFISMPAFDGYWMKMRAWPY